MRCGLLAQTDSLGLSTSHFCALTLLDQNGLTTGCASENGECPAPTDGWMPGLDGQIICPCENATAWFFLCLSLFSTVLVLAFVS